MIILSLTCAVLATWAVLPRAPSVWLSSRLSTSTNEKRERRRLRWWLVVLPLIAGLGVATAGALAGGAAAALALAIAICLMTAIRLAVSHARLRATVTARRSVTDACAALAAQVRVGRTPAEALITAAEDCPILAQAASAHRLGGDVLPIWEAQSRRRGCGGLADLARAWAISTRTGAPMAATLELVADGMASDEAVRTVVAGELAGPRATGKIMAVLPLVGLALGYALGGDPVGFLLGGLVGWGCLVGGALLAAVGVLWIEALARHAAVEGGTW
jgi:tight adherence protein B